MLIMKRLTTYLLSLAAAAVPLVAAAQVDKQVEVTKEYVPSIAAAQKLAVEPDMTDTVRMRPDIDYSITPLSWQTNLTTGKFRPATMTYWEFNRPQPFYLKAGIGYPLSSVGDLCVTTQNPDVGFLMLYVNHEGAYEDIKNYFGEWHDSRRMLNRAGVNLGCYAGRHTAEADLSYDNRLYHRYAGRTGAAGLGDRVNTGAFEGAIRFGDDFKDLSRVNFDIALRGTIFSDNSPYLDSRPDDRQFDYGGSASVARAFGRHTLRFDAGYDAFTGGKDMSRYRNDVVHADLRYGRRGGFIDYDLGADYWYDRHRGASDRHYISPFLHMRFNVSRKGHFIPFIEVDGELQNNDYMSLTRENPYIIPGTALQRNTMGYNFRFGIAGNAARDRIAYRLLVGLSIVDNCRFWYVADDMFFGVATARRNALWFDAEFTYRPVSSFALSLAATGHSYSSDIDINLGCPAFESQAKAEYSVRRWKFGVAADMKGKTRWTNMRGQTREDWTVFSTPFTVDLAASVEWQYRNDIGFFLEGRNLLNRRIYPLAYYPDYGIGFTFGVKVQF